MRWPRRRTYEQQPPRQSYSRRCRHIDLTRLTLQQQREVLTEVGIAEDDINALLRDETPRGTGAE